MSKFILIIFILILLIIVYEIGLLSNYSTQHRLECGARKPASLLQLQTNDVFNSCYLVKNLPLEGGRSFTRSPAELYLACSCDLINQQALYQELMTDKLNKFYHIIKLTVDPELQTDTEELDEESEKVSFLRTIEDILCDSYGAISSEGYSWMTDKVVTELIIYFDITETEAEEMLYDICHPLMKRFSFIAEYLKSMDKRTLSYDQLLFQLYVSYSVCKLFPFMEFM